MKHPRLATLVTALGMLCMLGLPLVARGDDTGEKRRFTADLKGFNETPSISTNGHGQLRQQGRIAVGVARDHAADAHPTGRLGDCRLQRPAFVDRAVWPDWADRGQVVEDPDMVEASLVCDAPNGAERLDRGVLTGVF